MTDEELAEKRRRRATMSLAEQIAESALERCVHFNGTTNARCKAGVSYFGVIDHARSYPEERFPCFREGPVTCDKLRFPTQEEAEEKGRIAEERSAQFSRALGAVIEHAGGRKGIKGALPCPCCEGGELSYSVAGNNGHIHARCSTQGCVQWMQ